MTLPIRIAKDNDREIWDRYVNSHEQASPYHLFAWRQAVEYAYGQQACYLLAGEGKLVKGVLPLVLFKIPLRPAELIALPYCDVGFPVADNESVLEALLLEAIKLGKRFNASKIEFRGDIPSEVISRIDLPRQVTSNKVRMFLSLPATSEDLWTGFKSKLRSQVRKAEKNDLSFSFDSGDTSNFYSVFSENMRDLGSPVHACKWIESILKNYAGNTKMGLVYQKEKCIGAGIILMAGQNVSIPWASTLRQYNRLGPNMLLYWNFLKFAADHGYKTFDFGRSTPNEGTFKFKSQWGAVPEELKWHTLSLTGKEIETSEKSSVARGKIVDIWSRLPLPLASFLGPKIRKYISL